MKINDGWLKKMNPLPSTAVVVAFIVFFLLTYWWMYEREKKQQRPHRDSQSGGLIRQVPDLPVKQQQVNQAIPDRFDWRDRGLQPRIEHQGSCGACWAYSAVLAFQERRWIASGGRINEDLAPQYLINCEKYCVNVNDPSTCDEACGGGYIEHAWEFLRDRGVPLLSCVPTTNRPAPCKLDQCTGGGGGGGQFYLVKAGEVYAVTSPSASIEENVRRIQVEVMTEGPVSAGMDGYADFEAISSGETVYRKRPDSRSIGGHAVRIIGWGTTEDDGTDYWTVVNQWGTSWGAGGVGRILRGRDEAGIESQVVAGTVGK